MSSVLKKLVLIEKKSKRFPGNKPFSKSFKRLIRAEKKRCAELKSARWLLLSNGDFLDPHKCDSPNRILKDRKNLALCYAMKEELRQIFKLKDPVEACLRRMNRFDTAKQSQISALAKLAFRKEKRGRQAERSHNISIGRLRGLIKRLKSPIVLPMVLETLTTFSSSFVLYLFLFIIPLPIKK